ncbi:MAG: nucleotidyltransferase substrate binding protein [Bacteroidetes bacterium]|nr:nucleotidyltransferase substrate binding protein [Bacteroidota bacterium]
MEQDIRWHQRFSNYRKALQKLDKAVTVLKHNEPDEDEDYAAIKEMLKEGLIQRFEYTHELAWNVMKDYAEYQGATNIAGSRDATRQAFAMQLITQPEQWMNMLQSRNLTTHTYNADTADEIYTKIVKDYHPLFIAFERKMESLRSGQQSQIFDKEV